MGFCTSFSGRPQPARPASWAAQGPGARSAPPRALPGAFSAVEGDGQMQVWPPSATTRSSSFLSPAWSHSHPPQQGLLWPSMGTQHARPCRTLSSQCPPACRAPCQGTGPGLLLPGPPLWGVTAHEPAPQVRRLSQSSRALAQVAGGDGMRTEAQMPGPGGCRGQDSCTAAGQVGP